MEETLKDLQQKCARYKRLTENQDFIETIKEVEEGLGLTQSASFMISRLSPEAVLLQAGMRDYQMALRDLVKNTEAAIEQKKQEENENE